MNSEELREKYTDLTEELADALEQRRLNIAKTKQLDQYIKDLQDDIHSIYHRLCGAE